jgi:hypothetical protein
MKLSVALPAALLALLAAGCGNDGGGAGGTAGGGSSRPDVSQQVGACATDSPGVTGATTLTRADLDGDGTPEDVRLTSPQGDCPGVVFAKVGSGYLSAQVPTDGPPVTKAEAVAVPGVEGQLLATTQTHPRGGFQLRLFSAAGGRLTELEDGGSSLVPFVATDVQEHPLSLSCVRGALVKTEAVAHEPAGVMPAWDIRQTTYTFGTGGVTAGAPKEVADNVLPAQLDARYADLAGHTMFRGCA